MCFFPAFAPERNAAGEHPQRDQYRAPSVERGGMEKHGAERRSKDDKRDDKVRENVHDARLVFVVVHALLDSRHRAMGEVVPGDRDERNADDDGGRICFRVKDAPDAFPEHIARGEEKEEHGAFRESPVRFMVFALGLRKFACGEQHDPKKYNRVRKTVERITQERLAVRPHEIDERLEHPDGDVDAKCAPIAVELIGQKVLHGRPPFRYSLAPC